MNSQPHPNPRHYGTGLFFLLVFLALFLYSLSFQKVERSRFRMTDEGVQHQKWAEPAPHSKSALWGSLACLVGAGAIATNEKLLNSETFAKDSLETLAILSANSNKLLANGCQLVLKTSLKVGKKTAKQVWISAAPAPIQTALDRKLKQSNWFGRFLKAPHIWVAGHTGGGKSSLLKALIVEELKRDPSVQITICDTHYGAVDNGEVNDWMGIPEDYVASELESIAAVIHDAVFADEPDNVGLEARKRLMREAIHSASKPSFIRRIIILDEFNQTGQRINESIDKKFTANIGTLLDEGRKYGFRIILVGQKLAVGESQINEATRAQMAIALLGSDCLKPKQVEKLGFGHSAELAQEAAELKKKTKFIAIVSLDGNPPSVVPIPDLRWTKSVKLQRKTSPDPDLQWWQTQWDKATQEWMQTLANQYVAGEIPSPLKPEILPRFGVKKTSNEDARYTRFIKPAWEQAQEQAKAIKS